MPLLQLPRPFHVNSSGTPYASAKLYTYRATTTTPLDTYTTAALAVKHANPIVADANGIFPAIYTDGSSYDLKVTLTTSSGVEIYTEDNIPVSESLYGDAHFVGSHVIDGDVAITGSTEIDGSVTNTDTNISHSWVESDQAADKKRWELNITAGVMALRTRTDANAAGKNIISVTRGSTTAISSLAFGNATDAPTITFNGESYNETGTFTGTLTGMSASTTRSFRYYLNNGIVTLRFATVDVNAFTGTSNTTAMTLTGLPAAITPTGIACFSTAYLTDNGSLKGGYGSVSGTTISFGVGIDNNLTGFTSSGTKGLGAFFTCVWSIR